MIDEPHLTYDDVLLKPQRSSTDSRSDGDLTTNVTRNVTIDSPLVSAPMDSVTEDEMAQAMADNGGVGIIHRFGSIGKRKEMVQSVDGTVGASVGIGREEMDSALKLDHHADFLCIDVAHAHLDKCIDFVGSVKSVCDSDIMVGNVATSEGAKDLIDAGADAIKVGIGAGSVCTTREKTGVGVPQFSAVRIVSLAVDICDSDVPVIADGGIRSPGDAMKALGAGASAVMMGGTFGRCEESPEPGDVWGMASSKAKEKMGAEGYIEGVSSSRSHWKTVDDVFDEYEDGIRSGMSYIGAPSVSEIPDNADFCRITPSTRERNGAFIK